MKHEINIKSLRDIHAVCSCGGWDYTAVSRDLDTTEALRRQAFDAFQLHVEATLGDPSMAEAAWSEVQKFLVESISWAESGIGLHGVSNLAVATKTRFEQIQFTCETLRDERNGLVDLLNDLVTALHLGYALSDEELQRPLRAIQKVIEARSKARFPNDGNPEE